MGDWVIELVNTLAASPGQYEAIREDMVATLPKLKFLADHGAVVQAVEQAVSKLRGQGLWQIALDLILAIGAPGALGQQRKALERVRSFVDTWGTLYPAERKEILTVLNQVLDREASEPKQDALAPTAKETHG